MIKLCSIFSGLDYPRVLIHVDSFITRISSFLCNVSERVAQEKIENSCKIRISLPFKDQVVVNAARKQFRNLSHKIDLTLQPVYVNRKVEQDLKPREVKPSIVN